MVVAIANMHTNCHYRGNRFFNYFHAGQVKGGEKLVAKGEKEMMAKERKR